MNDLYALLVGVDAYRAAPRLSGCRNDVDAVLAFLWSRLAPQSRLHALLLRDEQATRDAVIDGFRDHLARAGAGDVALFWFSGNGSKVPAPPGRPHRDAGLPLPTLLCVDSREGSVPDLSTDELDLLAGTVARSAGQVVLVVDACHSAGADRSPRPDADPTRGTRMRYAPPTHPAPALEQPLAAVARARHVTLSACAAGERAVETMLDGQCHGLFSHAVLRAMVRAGPGTTCRDLLSAARCEVEQHSGTQVPRLRPAEPGGVSDRPFLGDLLAPGPAGTTMRYADGWEIDAGEYHGLPFAGRGAHTAVAVRGSRPARQARVVRVLATRSAVEPVGWCPEPGRSYPMVISDLPAPPTTVALEDETAPAAARFRIAAATAADGLPTPHLRIVDAAVDRSELRVTFPTPGGIRLLDADRRPVCPDLADADGCGASRAVRIVSHIDRWRQIKALGNPRSGLAGAVRLQLMRAEPDDEGAPWIGRRLVADGEGLIRLAYRHTGARWRPPRVLIRLANRSDRPLYCVLLDLTDRYDAHALLRPGVHLEPGRTTGVPGDEPVAVTLPPGRPLVGGAAARHWLKVLVSEDEVDGRAYELPPLGDPVPAPPPAPCRGILDRLARVAVHRQAAGTLALAAGDWSTVEVAVVTSVPLVW